MQNSNIIEHCGIVESVENNVVRINILSASACSSCHLKGACSAAETENKIVEVFNPEKKFSIGEEVNVIAKESIGFKALFYGYLFPFIFIVSTLIITSFFTDNEAIIGLLSLVVLVPYYFILSFYKEKLKKIFTFKLQKI
ncbi:MAG: hypothetical protein DRJ01_04845 [Bacteroidetes bacterium]|nr:MAG: hypothetical protein DRJ01_04845 [Bacteroidota bacterium]